MQCIVRLEATEGFADDQLASRPEVLDENRFLAMRDGIRADFLDPAHDGRRPAQDFLEELLVACAPHAAELGCELELASIPALAAEPGAHRQRMLAALPQGEPAGPGLGVLVCALAGEFTAAQPATV